MMSSFSCWSQRTDRELFEGGVEIGRRTWDVPRRVMQKLGYTGYVMAGPGTPKIFERIQARMRSIYAAKEFASGGHIGVFMYRDIFARVAPPWFVGEVRFNPFDCVELTSDQKIMINHEGDAVVAYIDQFSDVADVQYGLMELRAGAKDKGRAIGYANLARLHLHAASAVLTGGYDFRGAVQSALLATELALKSCLAQIDISDTKLRREFGHDTSAMVDRLERDGFDVDIPRTRWVLSRQPKFVENRYSDLQPTRVEAGHIVMGAQFILAEAVRGLSDRRFRASIEGAPARVYPPAATQPTS